MTDRPSRSLEDEIRTHLKDHEAFCEPHCECVDIRLLRAALDRIEGLTAPSLEWFAQCESDRAGHITVQGFADRVSAEAHADVWRTQGRTRVSIWQRPDKAQAEAELSHLRAENARQAQEIQRLREALLRACEDSASGDHAQAGGPEWPSERFRHGAAPPAGGGETLPAVCLDCGLPYEQFPLDVVLPRPQWLEIHPDEHGLLCAACIVKRAAKVPRATCCHLIIEVSPPATGESAESRLTALEQENVRLRDVLQGIVGRAASSRPLSIGNIDTHRDVRFGRDELAELSALAPAEAERRAPPGEVKKER